ncbi:Pre-mRNA-splicing factor [Venturia nashicola]|uniref:Pre-mRNA-splicing factor n=1 Tax=Venturia nashicola TaxID=86259 RepID=A0A4Z1NYU9_9PEZI|nr:Pre-mRNA-splicing factor [Venturia nashicola]
MSTVQIPISTSTPESTEAPPTIPPPPYTPPTTLHCLFPSLNESLLQNEDDLEDQDQEQNQTSIHLSAPISIHGHGNIISFPTQEFTRMAACIVASIQKSTSTSTSTSPIPSPSSRDGDRDTKYRNININLNCGITINGQRNVIGTMGGAGGITTRAAAVRMQAQTQAGSAARAQNVAAAMSGPVAGSKRKAEEDVDVDVDVDVEEGPVFKRVDLGVDIESGASSSSSEQGES